MNRNKSCNMTILFVCASAHRTNANAASPHSANTRNSMQTHHTHTHDGQKLITLLNESIGVRWPAPCYLIHKYLYSAHTRRTTQNVAKLGSRSHMCHVVCVLVVFVVDNVPQRFYAAHTSTTFNLLFVCTVCVCTKRCSQKVNTIYTNMQIRIYYVRVHIICYGTCMCNCTVVSAVRTNSKVQWNSR